MGVHADILKDCKVAFKDLENLRSKFFEVSPYGGDEEARLLCQLLIKVLRLAPCTSTDQSISNELALH